MNWWNHYRDFLQAQSANITISNPLGQNTSIFKILDMILHGLVLLATPIVVLTVIYAGFMFVTAQGSVDKLQKAKTALSYALIGALILLGAEAISQLIQGSIAALSS